MKLAIAYSTKDQVELTEQTIPVLLAEPRIYLYWAEGSSTKEGQEFPNKYQFGSKNPNHCEITTRIRGGADAAIAWKLSRLLKTDATHIGLLENDVLLDPDWLEPTLALFEKGEADGLSVGAVSPRSYVDRVIIQRSDYAVMHNIGAGAIIFTREAAEIILRSFRTGWWPTNRLLFAQLSGIDLATYAAFRGQEQFVTTDWLWEAQLASHGLASLALTPAKCQMIGQVPPLKEQGLELTTGPVEARVDRHAFAAYRFRLNALRRGDWKSVLPGVIHREGIGMLFFAHQIPMLAESKYHGEMRLRWYQGFGPFAYEAGPGGFLLSLRVSGACAIMASGGDKGGQITVEDKRSGFTFSPELPAGSGHPLAINVPGGPVRREVTVRFSEGTQLLAVSTSDPQILDASFKFSWDQLPEAM